MPEFSNSEMNGYVVVERQNGKMGMYSQIGRVIIPEGKHKCWPEFCCRYGYYREVICIEKDGKVEVRSCDGKKVIISRKFKEIRLSERIIRTSNDGKTWGAYSYEGKEILPPRYRICFNENLGEDFILICVNEQNLSGVFSSEGKEIILCEHKYICFTPNHKLLFVTKKDDTVCMYSPAGKLVIDCQADELKWNSSTTSSIFANGKFPNDFILATRNKVPVGLYRYTGTKVVENPANYSEMHLENKCIVCVGKDGVSKDVYDFEGNKILEYKP